jgi:CBS domain-containing protein
MDIRELMTAPVRTLCPEDTLSGAAKLMQEEAIGCVPIVDYGKLVGILTDRDIAIAAYDVGEALWRLRIADHMRAPVYTCQASDDIAVAARTMREHRVRRLPVVDQNDKVVGMISLDDLVHASQQPVLDPTPGMNADELDAVVDATSGRSKHQPAH